FSTDVWSSSVVILGLLLVMAGRKFGIDWLRDADPVAALVVAGIVVHVSWRLARKTVDALLDAAPAGGRGQVIVAMARVEGVLEVDRARIRRAGNRYFVDLAVGLARTATFQHSGRVADSVANAVHDVLPDADVTVNSVPMADRAENIFDQIRAVATRH